LTFEEDLTAAANEELDLASALGWHQLASLTPWGDTYEGFTPHGRTVCFERSYLWEGEQGADIRVEVTVYEPKSFEEGVRLSRSIRRETG
jgi:hypothetical protein